jgi:hypothetical protein
VTVTPQTVSGDLAVAFHLAPDQLRLNSRPDRLAFDEAESQPRGGDPVDARDVVLNGLSRLEFGDQGDLPSA